MKKEDKQLLIEGGFAGAFGALCCLGPVIIVLFGLGSVSTALSIGRYTWLFTTLALLFFGAATLLYLRRKRCCTLDGIGKNWKVIALSFLLLTASLLLLKYWLAPLLAHVAYR